MATLSPLRPKRHLPGVDRGKTSDPYVVIEFAGSIRKSKVCKKTLSPVWDFRCEFDYEPGEVKISVYDWNLVMRRKLLGVVTVDARTAGPLAAERWHKLEGSVSGEALVTVRRARGGGGTRRPRQVRPRRPSPWTGARSAGGSSEALGMI